ncbi:glycoside hydrolase family 15 protein [Arthrobacter sp. ISL-65]|nr:glycoside hydrolase family 15 protein [Arthrobacter sp. ISL-65]MBT2551337.1 glycoside hydrolase family 15 protein [Arthrobacter sp. ISL-65]
MTYFPTGAIVAAPTTSLPEAVGGSRNWDYRYTWIRDASMTLQALWVAACPDEAGKFFQFLATAVASQLPAGDLQIMYGVGGEHDLSERELAHLPGWRSSSPVRVGNGAWHQRQLDVYGELLDAAATLPDYLAALDPDTHRFLADAADAAASRWQDTDQGIWEVRGEPCHFLHSKLMCWVAVDRAISLADVLGARDRIPAWEEARDQIAGAIHAHGWSDAANAYTQAFGSDELDASSLLLSIVGFLPADDPRMLATIEAIEQRLTDSRGLVYRYRAGDGLRARRARSCSVPSGSRRPSPSPDTRNAHGKSSGVPRDSPLIWGCWPKKSRRTATNCWGIFRRPSVTLVASTPRGPSVPRSTRRRLMTFLVPE